MASRGSSTSSSRSRGSKSRAGPAGPAKAPVVRKVAAYKSLRREAGAALEQVWPNAYITMKHVPAHVFGSVAPDPHMFAVHVEPGLFRTLDKLNELGMSPSDLVNDTHAVKFTAANLKEFTIDPVAVDAINHWAYKATGSKMAVNDLFGGDEEVYSVVSAKVFAKYPFKVNKASGPLSAVLGKYRSVLNMPLRDAAFIVLYHTPVSAQESRLAQYNAILKELRKAEYASPAKLMVPAQWRALSQALHAWGHADKETAAWPLAKYAETRTQSDAFFASLDWQTVNAASVASIDELNQKAMLKYKKEHSSAVDDGLLLA